MCSAKTPFQVQEPKNLKISSKRYNGVSRTAKRTKHQYLHKVRIEQQLRSSENNTTITSDIWSVGKEPIAMFEFTTWHTSFADFFIQLRCYTAIGKQLLFANNRNRIRAAVLGLSQDRACTNLIENFRENILKQDLSNGATVSPPHFSLVNTFHMGNCFENILTKPKKGVIEKSSFL